MFKKIKSFVLNIFKKKTIDLLYNEVAVPGKQTYIKGDWKSYAVHDNKSVKGFFGDYRFLSNFHESLVEFDGEIYQSSEAAYQAAKLPRQLRKSFKEMKANESKKAWKKHKDSVLPNWDKHKYRVMDIILFDKFRDLDLRKLLLKTGDKYLEETNHWGDTYWGVDIEKGGENNLGKILMDIRKYYQHNS